MCVCVCTSMYDLYLYRCRFLLLGAPLIDTGSKLWQTMVGKFKSRMTDKYLLHLKYSYSWQMSGIVSVPKRGKFAPTMTRSVLLTKLRLRISTISTRFYKWRIRKVVMHLISQSWTRCQMNLEDLEI